MLLDPKIVMGSSNMVQFRVLDVVTSVTRFGPSNLAWLRDLDLSNLVRYQTITSFWKKKLIFKLKTKFFSLETMCIVFRTKFYMIYVRTSSSDRVPLRGVQEYDFGLFSD